MTPEERIDRIRQNLNVPGFFTRADVRFLLDRLDECEQKLAVGNLSHYDEDDYG